MNRSLPLLLVLALLLAGCAAHAEQGMGDSGMAARHHTKIPAKYTGKTSPVAADEASLQRGQTIYTANCALCHGAEGMGDGPFGEGVDPRPAPVAHTSQMMSDAYLFWRISEGGTEFKTSMPSWQSLDEKSRWDVINYIRALGEAKVTPESTGTK